MKMKRRKFFGKSLDKYDYVKLNFNSGGFINCIVLELKKDSFVFLPTQDFLKSNDRAEDPLRVEMSYDSILDFKLNDNFELLLMIDHENQYLSQALEGIFYNERKNCR